MKRKRLSRVDFSRWRRGKLWNNLLNNLFHFFYVFKTFYVQDNLRVEPALPILRFFNFIIPLWTLLMGFL